MKADFCLGTSLPRSVLRGKSVLSRTLSSHMNRSPFLFISLQWSVLRAVQSCRRLGRCNSPQPLCTRCSSHCTGVYSVQPSRAVLSGTSLPHSNRCFLSVHLTALERTPCSPVLSSGTL